MFTLNKFSFQTIFFFFLLSIRHWHWRFKPKTKYRRHSESSALGCWHVFKRFVVFCMSISTEGLIKFCPARFYFVSIKVKTDVYLSTYIFFSTNLIVFFKELKPETPIWKKDRHRSSLGLLTLADRTSSIR